MTISKQNHDPLLSELRALEVEMSNRIEEAKNKAAESVHQAEIHALKEKERLLSLKTELQTQVFNDLVQKNQIKLDLFMSDFNLQWAQLEEKIKNQEADWVKEILDWLLLENYQEGQ